MKPAEKFMRRALEIAQLGKGNVAPNPMVGAVLVFNDEIVSEGYHEKYGGPHAEVNCLKEVPADILEKSTLYVSLEPCAHFGKTPPCAQLVIDKQIPEVVVAMQDPNPKVSGKGNQMLKDAGIRVHTGLLENEAKELNKTFIVNQLQKRPFITLKWAASADGFIAPKNQSVGEMQAISGYQAKVQTHQWRASHKAILVGYNTLKLDRPSLTTREAEGDNPIRIIWDPKDQVRGNESVFSEEGETLVWGPYSKDIPFISTDPFGQLFEYCYQHGIDSILVEGGAATHQLFIGHQQFDEIMIFQSDLIMYEGVPAPKLPEGLEKFNEQVLGKDVLTSYRKQ